MKNVKIFAFADEADKFVDGQVAAMLRNGLQGLEIRGVDGVNVSQITLEKAREVRKKLDDNGLAVWSVGSPIGKIRLDKDAAAHMDVLRRTLETANVLGAKNLRMFSFYPPDGETADAGKDRVVELVGQMLDLAEDVGVTLCHENEKCIFGDTAERCAYLHRQLPRLKAVFDPANFVQCGVDTLRAWELLKPYVHYMHIKDALPDGKVVPAGMGAGNVKAIVKHYLAQGGRVFTMEPHLTVFDGLKELEREGDPVSVPAYSYPTADAAFDAACVAFQNILEDVI